MTTGSQISGQLYTDIALFYARHMRAMDEGRVGDWTNDFTVDGIFMTNARSAPQVGRKQIAEAAHSAAQALEQESSTRRHCLSTLDVHTTNGDGTGVTAMSYATIVRTRLGEQSTLEFLCTCTDELIFINDRWQIQHREVRRDDLGR